MIEAAGGATVADFGVLLGGVMMAKPAAGLDVPVTKTTGGIVVLPAAHASSSATARQWPLIARIGRSACDQCRFCTEFCPRYLLGHPIQPHRAMQSLGFPSPADDRRRHALLLRVQPVHPVRLPRGPRSQERLRAGQARWRARNGLFFRARPSPSAASHGRIPPRAHAPADRRGWALGEFHNVGPLIEHEFSPRRVTLPLKQHAGAPAVAVVKTRRPRAVGDLLAAPEAGKLGARIHASIDGVVRLTHESVVIDA